MKTILPFLYSMLLKKTIILEFIQPQPVEWQEYLLLKNL